MAFTHQNKRFALRSVQIANPAAATDWTITVPAGMVWKLQAIHGLYTSSGTAGSREPRLQILDGSGNVVFMSGPDAAITATNAVDVGWVPGVPKGNTFNSNTLLMPIPPDFCIDENYVIRASTLNLTAGDQWSQINLLVEESSTLS